MKKIIFALLLLSLKVEAKTVPDNIIQNTTLEDCFAATIYNINTTYNVVLGEMDYGAGICKSEYVEYYRGIVKFRGHFQIEFSNSTCTIKLVDVQMYSTPPFPESSRWENSTEGLFIKKEKNMCSDLVTKTKKTIADSKTLEQVKKNFFTHPMVIDKFCMKASSIAVERYFNAFLKDQSINWDLAFNNIEKTNLADDISFKYKETYTYWNGSALFETSYFQALKYTNSEENALVTQRTKVKLKGFPRYFYQVKDGSYKFVLTDTLEQQPPINKGSAEGIK